jgi:type II secretory pathway component PulK
MRNRRLDSQRGIALIATMIALAIASMLATQFATSTTGDTIAAANYRDGMRAHFLARSALNLSELVIRVQQRLDNVKQLGGIQITDFADQVLLAFCGSKREVEAAIGLDSSTSKGLGADIGTCGVTKSLGLEPGTGLAGIDTDDGKINLNCANSNDATAATLKSKLDALMFFPAYDPVFEDADAEGWRRNRETQVAAIVDYIDNNSLRLRERGTSEDYGYESLRDDYRAKQTYIDTVGELKLARGVDDRLWNLFGHAFTVYGSCKTNIATVQDVQLLAAMLMLSAKNQNDPVLLNPTKLWALAGVVIKAKQFGMTFSSLDDFIDFVRDPSSSFGSFANKGSKDSKDSKGSSSSFQIPGLAPGEKIGLELDKTKLGQIASTGPRRTYRLYAWGEIQRAQVDSKCRPIFPSIRRTIGGVWDTKVINQNARRPEIRSGSWVFLKED